MIKYLLVICLMVVFLGCDTKPTRDIYSFSSKTSVHEKLPRISPSHIKRLLIKDVDLREEDLQIIGTFKNLNYLSLLNCKIEDQDLKYIGKLEKLEHLELQAVFGRSNQNNIMRKGIENLAPLINLKTLYLGSEFITDEGLSQIRQFKNLENLKLVSLNINGRGFEELSKLKYIRFLEIGGSSLTDESMSHIAKFRGLTALWLQNSKITDLGLVHLTHNYWLINFHPSELMTDAALLEFRNKLLANRKAAREAGKIVPPDNTLFINAINRNKEIEGSLLTDKNRAQFNMLREKFFSEL